MILGPEHNFAIEKLASEDYDPSLHLEGIDENTQLDDLIRSYNLYTKIKVSRCAVQDNCRPLIS